VAWRKDYMYGIGILGAGMLAIGENKGTVKVDPKLNVGGAFGKVGSSMVAYGGVSGNDAMFEAGYVSASGNDAAFEVGLGACSLLCTDSENGTHAHCMDMGVWESGFPIWNP